MNMCVKERLHWAAGYGLPRAMLKLFAYRGDPLSRLVIDTSQADNIYPLIEQVRHRYGRISLDRVFWVTADGQMVREVLRDDRFRTVKPRDRSPFRLVQWLVTKTDPDLLNPIEPPSMLVSDPPEHTRLRRLVSRAFTPRALDGVRARIHEVADGLLCDLKGRAECDLIPDYTSRIPIEVIAEMLGIPRDEIRYLDAIGDAATKLTATVAAPWRDFRDATTALREFDQYLETHVERLRQAHAADSILSGVIHDSDLSDVEIRMFAALLLGAGFITTSHVFGNAVLALVRHRDQLAVLQEHPEGWPNALEEVLRYDTAIQLLARVPTETVDVEGHTIRSGQAVYLLVGGANRDPAVFDRPEVFDTTRANAREHISFGTGVHVCLGAALARMELHIGLQSLFERFPQLTLAGEPILNHSMGLHGLQHLPVSLGAADVT